MAVDKRTVGGQELNQRRCAILENGSSIKDSKRQIR